MMNGAVVIDCKAVAFMTQAVADVLMERHRQVDAEGYGPEHDDALGCSELARAAASYLCRTDALMLVGTRVWPPGWEFKGSNYRRVLVKACALALAELERVDRQLARTGQAGAAKAPPSAFVHAVDVAEHTDTSRIDWLQAQASVDLREYHHAQPGGATFWEVVDCDDEVVGTAPTLRAAIDDAMGVKA